MPATPAIAIRETVDRDVLLPWWQGACAERRAIIESQGIYRAGPDGGLYAGELFQENRGEAIVFVLIHDAQADITRSAG